MSLTHWNRQWHCLTGELTQPRLSGFCAIDDWIYLYLILWFPLMSVLWQIKLEVMWGLMQQQEPMAKDKLNLVAHGNAYQPSLHMVLATQTPIEHWQWIVLRIPWLYLMTLFLSWILFHTAATSLLNVKKRLWKSTVKLCQDANCGICLLSAYYIVSIMNTNFEW